MTRWSAVLSFAALAACGSTSAPPTAPAPAQRDAAAEVDHEQELATAHNKLLAEQATAMAATCDKPAPPRCVPSCYALEPADPRAGKTVAGVAEITHLVCTPERDPAGPFVMLDELGAVAIRGVRGRVPKPSKKGSWQVAVETAAASALEPELARGDSLRVTGTWKPMIHPITKDRLRCVTVSHYTRSAKKLDVCGSHGGIACEAGGNAAAHGINVIHYRLAEATRFHAAHEDAKCQQASLEAIAVARGMPRWRQYVKLNTDTWKASPRYRTRFDGILDEDTLFQTAIDLGVAAQRVHVACGGADNPTTNVADEQSFHTCD